MVELRAKVKLTNDVDEVLVRRGLLDPCQIRAYEANALIKPETVRCVLPPLVVEKLGLWPDRANQRLVANPYRPNRYLNRIMAENSIG
jgi:hypothetical protein